MITGVVQCVGCDGYLCLLFKTCGCKVDDRCEVYCRRVGELSVTAAGFVLAIDKLWELWFGVFLLLHGVFANHAVLRGATSAGVISS